MAASLPAVLLGRLLEEQEVAWLDAMITELMFGGAASTYPALVIPILLSALASPVMTDACVKKPCSPWHSRRTLTPTPESPGSARTQRRRPLQPPRYESPSNVQPGTPKHMTALLEAINQPSAVSLQRQQQQVELELQMAQRQQQPPPPPPPQQPYQQNSAAPHAAGLPNPPAHMMARQPALSRQQQQQQQQAYPQRPAMPDFSGLSLSPASTAQAFRPPVLPTLAATAGVGTVEGAAAGQQLLRSLNAKATVLAAASAGAKRSSSGGSSSTVSPTDRLSPNLFSGSSSRAALQGLVMSNQSQNLRQQEAQLQRQQQERQQQDQQRQQLLELQALQALQQAAAAGSCSSRPSSLPLLSSHRQQQQQPPQPARPTSSSSCTVPASGSQAGSTPQQQRPAAQPATPKIPSIPTLPSYGGMGNTAAFVGSGNGSFYQPGPPAQQQQYLQPQSQAPQQQQHLRQTQLAPAFSPYTIHSSATPVHQLRAPGYQPPGLNMPQQQPYQQPSQQQQQPVVSREQGRPGHSSMPTLQPEPPAPVTGSRPPSPAEWACTICSYLHQGASANYLSCGLCGCERPGSDADTE
ncbi:MAG: hypothetical protein WDW38_011061 [Sanguina aurantia]